MDLLLMQEYRSRKMQGSVSKTSLQIDMHNNFVSTKSVLLLKSNQKVGETGGGRYKIYILHHISLMKKKKKKKKKKLLHSILGLPLACYVYSNLKHAKHENIN